jgi:hypothetical protein
MTKGAPGRENRSQYVALEQITAIEMLLQHVDTGEIGACQAYPGNGIEAPSDQSLSPTGGEKRAE